MPIKAEKLITSVSVPEGVAVKINRHMLVVDGPRGRAIKSFRKIPVGIEVSEGTISLKAGGPRKRDYAILNTARSLVRNLCQGVVEGYTVKMKIVYAHFPVTVKVQGDSVLIENFQGERAPRVARIHGAAKVNPQGDDVIVTGHVLTDVTQTAANIQLKTRIKNKDHRVFLDGIYVYDKHVGAD
jgi:large subunit ribosomal protein L6